MEATPPQFLDLVCPTDSEDRPPVLANFANVHGDGDVLTVDFFYVNPARVERIFDGQDPGPDAERSGDTVSLRSEPVARVALPLTTVAELVLEMTQTVAESAPHLRDALAEFANRMRGMADAAEGGARLGGTTPALGIDVS
ncbi:MAG: hypothetical protein U0169_17560 [Polyangiaceae bacterium]